MENRPGRFHGIVVSEGMEVMVSMMPQLQILDEHQMNIYGPSRGFALILSVAALVVGMLIMGRMKGLYAAVSLAFTLVMVIFFMVALIVRGGSPVPLALGTAIVTTAFTLGMVSGFSRQTLAAIAGTGAGLVAAGLFSIIFSRLANISGIHLEDARQILYHTPPDIFIRIPDLFFAGVIIAASGAVEDAAMSISSASFEIKEQSPAITARRLYRSGMRIGGDILGANANTFILALAGASLTTVIMITLFGFPFLRVINLDLVAIEVIRSVAATMGMLIGIPATALFSALLATRGDKKGR